MVPAVLWSMSRDEWAIPIRARIYIMYPLPSGLPFPFKKYALKHIYQSASYEKVHVNPQKKSVYILQMSIKALLLHPLSGTKAAMV